MDLKELSAVDPSTHWYYQSKLAALSGALRRLDVVPRRMIDVGAGSGFFSLALAAESPGCEVVCVDPNYPEEALGRRGPAAFVRSAEPSAITEADTFLFIDVLEHVSDDAGLLREYVSGARPGAVVLATVPAFMSLWSGHDEYLEHFRRYRLEQLVGLSRGVGLDVLHAQYLFGAAFPAAWAVRRTRRGRTGRSDMRSVAPAVNAVLRSVATAEHRLGWNPLAGVSAFVVGRVPQPAG